MSSALDQFGESLVRASHTLHRERLAAGAGAGEEQTGAGMKSPRRASRVRGSLRRGGWRIPAGALLVGVLAAAGNAVFGPTGNPEEITQIQCGQRGSSAFVTGEPVRDCATLWPSLYHRPAPPLVAWVAETGGVVVVTAADRPPAGAGWRRLPSGWKANAAVLGLRLQLEDITTGFEAHRCWAASRARALVTSILRSDGLGSWTVHVHHDRPDGAHPNCLTAIAATGAEPHSVVLVETWVQDRGNPATLVNAPSGPIEHARLTSTETHVNSALRATGRCAGLREAASLWRSGAAAAGISDARYVLFTQTGTSRSPTKCARVLVDSPGGGGPAYVYAADLP
jgi:hypothetical protein